MRTERTIVAVAAVAAILATSERACWWTKNLLNVGLAASGSMFGLAASATPKTDVRHRSQDPSQDHHKSHSIGRTSFIIAITHPSSLSIVHTLLLRHTYRSTESKVFLLVMLEEPSQRQQRVSSRGIRLGTMVTTAWICLSARGARAAFFKSAPASNAYGFHSMARAKLQADSAVSQFKSSTAMKRTALVRPMSATADSKTTAATDCAYDIANMERGLDKYDPSSFESEIYAWWEQSGCFQPDAKQAANGNTKQPYVLPMPPPNVTGRLHMGHAIFVALQDILARFHRMRGRPVLWLPGTDHAGIATQLQVEKQLIAEGTTREEVGREVFLDKVWEYKAEQGGHITRQLRSLGASADWTRERFTMDNDMSESVTEAFVRLHEKGLVYRGEYMVNWAPLLKTAVSDLEVEYTEEQGKLYFFKYMVEGSEGKIYTDRMCLAL
jgi:hypothetical protein